MDTPMPPEEVVRVLEGMSFFQKRALKKAGFKTDGLIRLAGAEYGAGLAEAVLACHTDLLGREPRAEEPEKAKAAQRHPGVRAASSSRTSADVSASGRGQMNIDPQVRAMMRAQRDEKKKAEKDDKERRDRPSGERKLP